MSSRSITLRGDDVCAACGTELDAGVRALWRTEDRTVVCSGCHGHPVGDAQTPSGTGGESAQREYERRSAARAARVREHHPKLARVLLALFDDPASTRVWQQGAAGERAVAETLDLLPDVAVLHDRRLRAPDGRLTRANIDHLVIAASGVWVIDAKTHRGRLEVRRSGGVLRPRVQQLRIDGRDRSGLVQGVHGQVAAVRAVLAESDPDVVVHGALCFVGTELPWGDREIDGVPLRGRRGLRRLVRQAGPLDADRRAVLHRRLGAALPPA